MLRGSPEVSADSYVRALSPAMWALTLLAMLLLCVALRALAATRVALGMAAGVQPAAAVSLGSCFLSVLGSLCSQGVPPQTHSPQPIVQRLKLLRHQTPKEDWNL